MKHDTQKPFMKCTNHVVVEVNCEFTCLTGFLREEIVGATLMQAGKLLRTFDQLDLSALVGSVDVVLFTKELVPVKTTIQVVKGENGSKTYRFLKHSSTLLKEHFDFADQFYTDRQTMVCMIGYPDRILLQANDNYFRREDHPDVQELREYSIGRKQLFHILEDRYPNVEEFYRELVEGNKPFHVEEYEFVDEKGVTYWNLSIVPMRVNGVVECFLQAKLDVTEAVMARKQLEQLEQLEQQESLPDHKDELEINGAPIFDEKDIFRTGILSCQDITEHTKVQEMVYIKSQYDMLNKIIENMDMAVLRLSYPGLKIKDMNQKVLRRIVITNAGVRTIQDVRGKDMREVFIPEFARDVDEDIKQLVEGGENTLVSTMRRMVENEERHSKFIYQPVRGFNNEIVEIAIIGVDVTQEVKARHQLEHSMRMQEELFANISHELKTPINVIFSVAQLFEYYVSNALVDKNMDKIVGGIQTLKQNCFRLTKLISNIIDMSKLETGFMNLSLKNQNVVSVAEDIVQSVAEYVKEMGRHILFDANVEEKIIACDADKIERILLNLISNSVKFTEEGDEILVEVEDLMDKVQISVKDNGIGIEPCKLDMIFDRYRQIEECGARNHEGSGIGLSLVKSIVELHGGTIEAESEPGNGSVFRIILPSILVEDDEIAVTASEESIHRKSAMISVEFSDLQQLLDNK